MRVDCTPAPTALELPKKRLPARIAVGIWLAAGTASWLAVAALGMTVLNLL